MSKKDKKRVKINQKISQFFDADPFDVGVARVESVVLSELFTAIGYYDIPRDRDSIVKLARTIWSEADTDIRELVFRFFKSNQKIYKTQKKETPSIEKEQKLSLLLSEFELSVDEEVKLREAFEDVRAKKITLEKISSKLEHIRFEAKKRVLEKDLEGFFNIDDTLEFNAILRYDIFNSSFNKIIPINTKSYEYKHLMDCDIKELIDEISKDKLIAKEQKQLELDKFLSKLSPKNRYLTQNEMLELLKSSQPKQPLHIPTIKKDILYRIISQEIDAISIHIYNDELLLTTKEQLDLPYSTLKKEYNLEAHLEVGLLLKRIWLNEELGLTSMIANIKKENESIFLEDLHALANECSSHANVLNYDDKTLYEKIYLILLELLNDRLNISSKVSNKALKRFIFSISEELLKKQRYEFLARSIRDFKNLFPLARSLRRKLILHIGPTNSGKTYQAMQKLKNSDTGYYLAPLRLLALEGYEDMLKSNLSASLITGEEQIIDESATHISSTIEMLNFMVDVDVCVIDEAQMMDDRDRGWAWANAIIGAPAKEVILTASPNAKDAIVALASYLNEELEIVEFERKNGLKFIDEPIDENALKPNSAIIAFSRRDVLSLKRRLTNRFSISVVYGNLSPEVRREEARRFREGKSELLIATDAIAMGLNLPIKTLLFSSATKFDGYKSRELHPHELHQISGRAGRYGFWEEGFVGAMDKGVLKTIKKVFNKEVKNISLPLRVMANLEHVKLISTLLEEKSLSVVLDFFVQNMEFSGPFVATNIDDMLEACKIIDNYDLDIITKYHLACAPLTLNSPYILHIFTLLQNRQKVAYNTPLPKNSLAHSEDELLRAEDMVKEISLYLWLSFRFDEYFPDTKKANEAKIVLNNYIEKSLEQSHLRQKCRECGALLKPLSTHSICDKCFKKFYRRSALGSPKK